MTNEDLINGLRAMLASDDDCGHAIAMVAAALAEAGAVAEIETNDDCNFDGSLWAVSAHTLIIDGETVAEWTRCSRGTYGEPGRQLSEDEWCVTEDTYGGDSLPANVAVALESLSLEDCIPGVPEPPKATDLHAEDEDGEYAVYWETVGDDAHLVGRYADYDAAEAVCEQKNREWKAANPIGGGSRYLCCYGVRELVGGKWTAVESVAD